MRQLKLRMSDESIKIVMVDENQPVANLMVLICTKLGITNHDEYSLIATGKHTINGRRKDKGDRVLDQKMEQLKKKLKTDEDLAWLDHSKTLDENGVGEQDACILRRKFFYSDQNVDSRDPIQLNLLYVQTRDAIISGTHPVTVDGACKFAGIQCQAQLGDFSSGTSIGPANLKDYLPYDYAKIKQIERKIHAEHKKHYGIGELEAKARYVSEARSLPTYGVTFFLVKEKVSGKNKLVPRLLGVTRDCVMRVDANTKAILKTWPLTTVKRWAASLNSFTLDFGDYSDSYYSVQTSEGEQISQLIAGYIDIILKRKKAKDHFGIDGDEGSTLIEDSVAPSRATIMQHQPQRQPAPTPPAAPVADDGSAVPPPTVMKSLHEEGPFVEPPDYRPATEIKGKAEIGFEPRPPTQYPTSYVLSGRQRQLADRIEAAQYAVDEASRELASTEPTSGQQSIDTRHESSTEVLERKRRHLSTQVADMNAATAQLVSLSAIPEEELDYPALNQAVETVANQLPVVARDVKIVAALMQDDEAADRLVDAARKLCRAFSDLLSAAEPGPPVARQSLISAASRVGDATSALLYTVNNQHQQSTMNRQQMGDDDDDADVLLSLAKAVASAAASLVLRAKDVASSGVRGDQEAQNAIIGAATQCALATSQMVATAKIVAPTIHDAACQRQLIDSCREVARVVRNITNECRAHRAPAEQVRQVNESAERVELALDELLAHVHALSGAGSMRTRTVNKIMNVSERIIDGADQDDQDEMVRQAKLLARATAQLIEHIKYDASQKHQDSDTQRRLMGAAKVLADATARLIDAAKGCQSGRPNERHVLREAAQQVADTAANAFTDQSFARSTTTRTFTTNERVLANDTLLHQQQQRQQVEQRDEQRNEQYNVTSTSTTNNRSSPYEQHMITIERNGNNTTNNTNVHNVPAAHKQSSSAISGIIGDLETTIMFATAGTLRVPDDSDPFGAHRDYILRTAKALVDDTKALVTNAASDEANLARATHDAVDTITRLAERVKAGAAALGPANSQHQVALIRAARDAASSLDDLIGATHGALGKDVNDIAMVHVKDTAKTMVTNVTSLLRTLKNVEDEHQRGARAIEAAIEAIDNEMQKPATAYGTQVATPEELVRVTKPVTLATAKTVSASGSGKQDDVIVAANMGRKAIVDLLTITRQAANGSNSHENKSCILNAGQDCAVQYRHLLELLYRALECPADSHDSKQQLIDKSRTIATCVNEIINCSHMLKGSQGDFVDTSDPTVIAETELMGAANSIDAAAKKLENLKPRLTSVKLPHEELNFDEMILEAAKYIIEATAALLRAASASQRELVVGGRLDEPEGKFYASDYNQWSEGLVSAARMVAAATHSLVEASNALVQGQASEERLISAAKQVASSTNQLLVACKVKAEPESKSMARLQGAGQSVKRATDNLVRAAQQAIEHDEEQSLVISNRKVSGIAQEISAREQILRKEKELQVAKTQLMAIRKAKYSNRPDDYQGYGGDL